MYSLKRPLEHAALVIREQTARRARQPGCGLGAHRLDRVVQQGRDQADVTLGVGGRQVIYGRAADQGFAVHERPLERRCAGVAGIGDQKFQCGCAHDHRVERVLGQADQALDGAGLPVAAGLDDLAVMRPAPGPIPLGDGFVGPAAGFVDVAAGAGVGHAELEAEVRPGDPEAVIQPIVNPHVVAPGHVALDALGPGPDLEQDPAVGGLDGVALFTRLLVEMMLARVVVARPVALQAQAVAVLHAPDAVDVVAIAAAHIPRVHLALGERGVRIHLFQNLAVREVQVPGEQARQHGVEQVRLGVGVVPQDRSSGVARRAQLHGLTRFQLGGAHRQLVIRHGRASHVGKLGPLHMPLSGAVAGLAADVDVRPGGPVRVGLEVVVLAEVGGMARRAHPVPVLRRVGPIQPVLRLYRLVRVEVIPALGLHVPGDGQALHPAAGKRDQVLLEGVPAEGVRDLEIPHPSFRALGVDEEFAVLAIEP